MESDIIRRLTATSIKTRLVELREQGFKTSRGEPMSLAAIARTLDPPVNRSAISLVVSGRAESKRIKAAIEKELNETYWIRRKTG